MSDEDASSEEGMFINFNLSFDETGNCSLTVRGNHCLECDMHKSHLAMTLGKIAEHVLDGTLDGMNKAGRRYDA